jgi:hypothetical protein
MSANGRSMYVFRDGKRSLSGGVLAAGLAASLQNLECGNGSAARSQAVLDALLRAGELECGLTDADAAEAPRLAQLTDLLAGLLAGAVCPAGREVWSRLLPQEVPPVLQLTPPEGFTYYALHPLDFADLAGAVPLAGRTAAVIGIRSIGTTLSAVVAAMLRGRGLHTERITVRPYGHPYDRHTGFSPSQLRWVKEQQERDADFLVVDEGPGMSGSSFLSVGEALVDAGVDRSRVQFLCSRQADGSMLCARDATARWAQFRSSAVHPATRLPEAAQNYLGGGYWRHELIGPDPALWPASWSQMERMKFLSPDGRQWFKFLGLGRFGEQSFERALVLAEAGYSPVPELAGDGFVTKAFVPGRIMSQDCLDREVLDRMAGYCALRQTVFRSLEEPMSGQLETMLRFNVSVEFDVDLPVEPGRLFPVYPVVVDGRMLPHEWVRAHGVPDRPIRDDCRWRPGWLMKCDSANHGDDHFFPGPATDICWDLAGAIVEWGLRRDAADYFVRRYQAASGDDPRGRLPWFLLAYAVFRLGHCKMGAEAMKGSEEEGRLLSAYRHYRQYAAALLPPAQGAAADLPLPAQGQGNQIDPGIGL